MKKVLLLSLLLICGIFAQDISITVTNQNLALVREERALELQKGKSIIEVTDVPRLIDATSVHIKGLDYQFSVLEQNFEYDLLDANKVLNKSIGKNVMISHPESGTISGKLLFSDGANAILKTKEGELRIVPRNDEQQVILEEYDPDKSGLIIKPTLVWLLHSESKTKAKTEISYLTRGLNWHAEYVAILNKDDSELDLSSWVSLDNKSGKTYKNTRLKLMAGDLNLVTRFDGRGSGLYRDAYAAKAEASQFTEKEFFEYHLYSLSRNTTIKNNQTKQVQLFNPTTVDCKKIYNYNYQKDPQKVRVLVHFKNEKSNRLGIPLPKGKVRIFKKDDKEMEFIGEDLIDHTPKDEELKVEIGKAFDIRAERKVLEKKRLSKQSEKQKIEIVIKNHKNEEIDVLVTEPLGGFRSWEILKSSHKVKNKDASKAEFIVAVNANDDSTFIYEVIFNW
jgi:hypothetical protein